MDKTLVINADAAFAKIYAMGVKYTSLHQIGELKHDKSRLQNREIASDKPGRTFNSVGSARHAKERPTSPHQHEKEDFANQLADYIEDIYYKNKYEKIILIAGPEFMGLLRENLDEQISEAVSKEITKHLIELKEKELVEYLKPF